MRAEVHRTATNEQGVSSMEPAGDLTIAPGTILTLAPGGLHAMLMNLQAPINKGDRFKLTLKFAEGGEVTVEVVARGIAARGPRD
jgi:copper(I)-binding protein